MTFNARETSISGGQPVRLYEFQRGLIRWYYTNADRQQVYDTHTFMPIAISDDGIRQAGEPGPDALKITVPYNNPVAALFRGIPPAGSIDVTVRDAHYGDSQVDIRFMGSIQNVRRPSPERAELNCQSLMASMENPGLRIGWERNCPYSVYDHNCGVDPTPYGVEATLSSITGSTISAGAFDGPADGFFSGGFILWPIGSGEFDRRGIESHAGTVLTLLGGSDGLAAGRQVKAFPGCPRTIETCITRFNNKNRYGGVPHIPGKSPFDGDPLF